MSWIADDSTGKTIPAIGRGGAPYSLSAVVDTAGKLFSLESCKKEYVYDGNDNLQSIRATEPGTNIVRVKTYALSATLKPAAESGWVPV